MCLLDDVSQGELLRMREEGMSNQEIADSLDVSYQTVLRAIGKQPPMVRRSLKLADARVPVPVAPKEEPEPCLMVTARSIDLMGNSVEYIVDTAKERVMLTLDGSSILLPFSELSTVIRELSAIQRRASKEKPCDEMW